MIVLYFLFSGIFAQTNCPWIFPQEGAVLYGVTSVAPNTGVTVNCAEPKYFGDSKAYTCDGATGQWTPVDGAITCTKIECPAEVPHGDATRYTSDCDSLDVNSVCFVRCATGYKGSTSDYVCTYNGTAGEWSGSLPSCQAITCPSTIGYLTSVNGADTSATCADTSFGATCEAQCTQAYSGGPITYVCAEGQVGGVWNPQGGIQLTCTPRSCDATLSHSSNVQVNSAGGPSIVQLANTAGSCVQQQYRGECTASCIPGWGATTQNFQCEVDEDTGTGVIWTLLGAESLHTCTRNDCGSTIEGLGGIYDYTCADTLFEDDCNVQCVNGYSGASTTYTCGASTWEGSPPTCTKRSCTPSISHGDDVQVGIVLQAINQVTTSCSTYAFGDTCTAQCTHGYGTDSQAMKCTYNAAEDNVIWQVVSGTLPVCAKNDCGTTIDGLGGIFDYTCADTLFGDECDVQCVNGYTGTATKYTCGASTWEGSPPTCTKRTCTASISHGNNVQVGSVLQAINRVTTSCSAYAFGDTCTAQCTHGYGTDAQAMKCTYNADQGDVIWQVVSGTLPVCTKNDCGSTIEGLGGIYDYTCANTLFEDDCDVECANGYSGTSTTYTCGASTWEGSPPTCTKRSCTASISHGDNVQVGGVLQAIDRVTASCSSYAFLDTCIAQCTYGYGTDAQAMSCEYNAAEDNVIWEVVSGTLPVCTKNNCGPTIEGLGAAYDYTCGDTLFSDSCEVTCANGYSGGSATYTCGASTWEGTPPTCTKRSCTATISNGDSIEVSGAIETVSLVTASCSTYAFGDTCNAQCPYGFGTDSQQMTCVYNADQGDVIWSGTPPVCAKNDCGSTIPSLGVFYNYTCAAGYTFYEDECSVNCQSGYTGAASTYTCGAATWEGSPPDCQPLNCGPYENHIAPNTELFGECSGNFPGSCNFQCKEGFIQQTMVLHCVNSGEWSGTNITCVSLADLNATSTTIYDTEDRTTEWVIFWIAVSIGGLCLLLCCCGYIYIKTDPDGDKRGIGKKGLTRKQQNQLHDTIRMQMQQLTESDEWKRMRSFLVKQDTRHNVFDGVSDTSPLQSGSNITATSSSQVALEVEDKRI